MYKILKAATTFICIMFFLVACSDAQQQKTASKTGLGEGEMAPDFILDDLSGKQVKLSSFRGKNFVYLTFWATWCPYCVREIPTQKKMYSEYSAKGLKILAVNVGSNDPIKRVTAFYEKHKLPYQVLYDKSSAVSQLYGVQGIPVSILIDRKGIIRYRGFQLPEDIAGLMKKVL